MCRMHCLCAEIIPNLALYALTWLWLVGGVGFPRTRGWNRAVGVDDRVVYCRQLKRITDKGVTVQLVSKGTLGMSFGHCRVRWWRRRCSPGLRLRQMSVAARLMIQGSRRWPGDDDTRRRQWKGHQTDEGSPTRRKDDEALRCTFQRVADNGAVSP
ncbi:hypothetical protein B296_00043474 [Ensete ventricosum]|uniref:Uncharacterized protein n=1 Tax=Ensete ventricosum TaxID=4639 RepID=A0A426YYB8_ENSVE|nr:hypothetical protein B296_00043474 [Ensete ventricosum]